MIFAQNPFMATKVFLFSDEAKQTFEWINVAPVQMDLITLQENVTLKEEIAPYDDPVTFWTYTVS